MNNHKTTRKNAKEHNRTELSYQKAAEEARRSKEVIINQSNPSIIPITITQDGLLGAAAAANQSPGGGADKSPIIQSMINKSSNTTLGGQMGG
jgi:hypothetical protein